MRFAAFYCVKLIHDREDWRGGILIKLITIDLDGTLLDSDSYISGENREAISYCINRGIKVTLSTGKSMKCVGRVIREMGLKDLQIVSGGTMVIDQALNPIITIKIPGQSVIDSVRLARDNDVGFALDTTKGMLYYDRDFPELKFFMESGEVIKKVDNILTDHVINNALLFTFTVNNRHPFNSILEKSIGPDVKIRRGGPYYLNVLNINAGKVAGLKEILKIYGIDPGEVMAIGDNNNDMGTLEFAGLSVAMGNATEQVKKIADHITEDNDNSGVAKAINKFVKGFV